MAIKRKENLLPPIARDKLPKLFVYRRIMKREWCLTWNEIYGFENNILMFVFKCPPGFKPPVT